LNKILKYFGPCLFNTFCLSFRQNKYIIINISFSLVMQSFLTTPSVWPSLFICLSFFNNLSDCLITHNQLLQNSLPRLVCATVPRHDHSIPIICGSPNTPALLLDTGQARCFLPKIKWPLNAHNYHTMPYNINLFIHWMHLLLKGTQRKYSPNTCICILTSNYSLISWKLRSGSTPKIYIN